MKPTNSEITMPPKPPLSQTGTQAGELGLATQESLRRVAYPAATPQHAKSLSQAGLSEHRQRIASEVKIVLSAYFKPTEDDGTRAGQLAWWCDELQDWTQEQVVWGLRKWNRDNPRARPTPGDVLGLLLVTRGKREAERMAAIPKPPEPDRKPLTADERRAIAAKLGLRDLSGLAKPFDNLDLRENLTPAQDCP